jgi:tRNA U34 5-methylaminomethyl-2-thiouridine-forming methyltransferase MnmC
MDKISIRLTGDGSFSLYNEDLKEVYHSKHGALTESRHVFLEAGLKYALEHAFSVNLLEIGMGTGLNVLLSALEAGKQKKRIRCVGVEPFPPNTRLIHQLNYDSFLPPEAGSFWDKINKPEWNCWIRVNPHFVLLKCSKKMEEVTLPENSFNLVFFDAFAPEIQPELWTHTVFLSLFHSMVPGGVLVTYSVKGEVQRNLKKCGFKTEKIPGPPGKREMLRAIKPG